MSEQDPVLREISALDPEADVYRFRNGFEAELLPLETRQLFRLLRIITHGAGMALQRAPLDFSRPLEEFGGQLAMMVLISLPDAEEETLQFVQSLCRPARLRQAKNPNKQDREYNEGQWAKLRDSLDNPNPNDLLDIVLLVVDRDKDMILDLGKRAWALIQPYLKTGQADQPLAANPTPEEVAQMSHGGAMEDEPQSVQAGSPPPLISYPLSTDGAMSESSDSPSDGSGRSPRPSRRVITPASANGPSS